MGTVVTVLFTIIALLLFLAFIVWDRRRLAKTASSQHSQAPLIRKSHGRALGFSGIALMTVVMALHELFYPRLPPFTGRWAFVHEFAHSVGPYGLALYWALLATAFALAALVSWRTAGRSP